MSASGPIRRRSVVTAVRYRDTPAARARAEARRVERARELALKVLGPEDEAVLFVDPYYSTRRPANVIAIGGFVAVRGGQGAFERIWQADIDVTLWLGRLVALARLLEEDIGIFTGDVGREPGWALGVRALLVIDRDGAVTIGPRFRRTVYFAPDGTLRRQEED